jgi:pilus assembly protein FimV
VPSLVEAVAPLVPAAEGLVPAAGEVVPAVPQGPPVVRQLTPAGQNVVAPPFEPAAGQAAPGPQVVAPARGDGGEVVVPGASRTPAMSSGSMEGDGPWNPASSNDAAADHGATGAQGARGAASAPVETADPAGAVPVTEAPPTAADVWQAPAGSADATSGQGRPDSTTALGPVSLGSIASRAGSGSAPVAHLPMVASASRLPHAPALAALGRAPRTRGAIVPPARLPGAPAASAGAGASGTASPPAAYALLVAALAFAAAVFSRLLCAPARWRPVLFISLLERPG